MVGFLIGFAVLVAIAVTGVRVLQRRAAERAQPGGSPATAIPIENYAEIDVAVRMLSCRCGGRFVVRGEGPAALAGRRLRIAHLECRRCQREHSLYFDLTDIRH